MKRWTAVGRRGDIVTFLAVDLNQALNQIFNYLVDLGGDYWKDWDENQRIIRDESCQMEHICRSPNKAEVEHSVKWDTATNFHFASWDSYEMIKPPAHLAYKDVYNKMVKIVREFLVCHYG